jgi:hypothetical protein
MDDVTSLSPVAALYARRKIPALTERRYKISKTMILSSMILS